MNDYNTALALAPNDAETYYRRGHLFEESLHDHEKAVADYTTSIRLEPNNPAAYHTRAISYFNLHRVAEAQADLDTEKHLLETMTPEPRYEKRAAGEWE